MKRIQKLLLKLRSPGVIPSILLTICSAILLIYTFTQDAPNDGIRYFSYLLSAYTLVVLCFAAFRFCKRGKNVMLRISVYRRYKSDTEYRLQIGLYTGLGINILYAAFKFASEVYYHSLWFGAVAVYYLILSMIRFYVLKSIKQRRDLSDDEDKILRERRGCRTCGWLLLTLDLAIAIMALQMILQNEGYHYPGTLIYASAAYTFYRLILTVSQYVKFRHSGNLLFSAVGALNLSVALMALFALQTAMFASFGNEESFRFTMNSIVGGAVCLSCLCIAVILLIRSRAKKRDKKSQ